MFILQWSLLDIVKAGNLKFAEKGNSSILSCVQVSLKNATRQSNFQNELERKPNAVSFTQPKTNHGTARS